MLNKQLCEVNPVINHKRLTALCVPACHCLQGRGVLCVEYYTQNGAQIQNYCKVTTIISTTHTSKQLKNNSSVLQLICYVFVISNTVLTEDIAKILDQGHIVTLKSDGAVNKRSDDQQVINSQIV